MTTKRQRAYDDTNIETELNNTTITTTISIVKIAAATFTCRFSYYDTLTRAHFVYNVYIYIFIGLEKFGLE